MSGIIRRSSCACAVTRWSWKRSRSTQQNGLIRQQFICLMPCAMRMRSNTVKLNKKQKHTTEWPYTATVYLFDTLRMRRNTVKLEQLSRQDHRTEVECRGNNNNHTKPVSKSVRIEMICKYCACFLHQSINQSCQIRSLALFAIPLGFIYWQFRSKWVPKLSNVVFTIKLKNTGLGIRSSVFWVICWFFVSERASCSWKRAYPFCRSFVISNLSKSLTVTLL